MEQTITIPSYEQLMPIPKGYENGWNGSEKIIPAYVQTRTIPQQTITIPSRQTTNNHLGFILRNNGGNNYSVSVRELDDSDISKITKRLDGNNTAFMNASIVTRENTWYNVVARISENETTAELYDKNSTLLKSITTRDDAISIDKLGILMAFDTDTVIAFKNLKVETLDHTSPTVDGNHITVNGLELLAPYIGLTILLAVAVATVVYVKKRKRARSANYNFSLD
jgi:hypothetical protein